MEQNRKATTFELGEMYGPPFDCKGKVEASVTDPDRRIEARACDQDSNTLSHPATLASSPPIQRRRPPAFAFS